ERCTGSAGNTDFRSDVVEGIERDIADHALVSADALTDFSPHAQPVQRIEFKETAYFTAPAHRVQSANGVFVIVALPQELARHAGAKIALIGQRQRYVVVTR